MAGGGRARAKKQSQQPGPESKTTTFEDVSEEVAHGFVQQFLGGQLTPAGRGKTQTLSFHLKKAHQTVKCRSGRFDRCYTGGSVSYYPTSRKLSIRTANSIARRSTVNLLNLWEKYQEDSRPLIEQVKDHPEKFHKEKLTSGRYKGQFFQTVYNKEGYLDFVKANPAYYVNSKVLRTKMFYEYAMALNDKGVQPKSSPKKRRLESGD
mmetsp:Transcript_69933/g.114687  ORF Transcript_69933/g.114687 Transcript_69933/m.114687 type:complete len:207 (+) Transcript_69933:39-659(+)